MESLLLELRCLRLVVIVEPGLANGHHTRVIQFLQQPVQGRGLTRREIQRVYADRAVHITVAVGQGLHCGSVIGAHANAEELPNAPGARRIERCIEGAAMGSQVKAIKMTMRVDQHGAGCHWRGTGKRRLGGAGDYMVWVGRSDFSAPAR
ncbi:hypothetical protein PtoMrB4_40390 [Metapseudomonas otitidis]|uniref:Uncharacterized protein n=1 Tax=Metapseudomonas otitidis TaxID=319939 RepID=A0A679GKU6_9GAMM|nr:hypothetical protein PtoMrB4_40390 [Pseudomonas otitidis]